MNSTLKRMLQSILFIILTVWVLLSLLLWVFQPSFIYYPYKKIETTPAAIGLPFEEIQLTTSDNVALHGWWIPNDNARYTLLFFHGNAGNISHRLESIRIFHELGLSVFIFDYRGYGQSEGKPGEKGTYRDAEAAWQFLVDDMRVQPEKIIIFGRSLGGAIASWLAAHYAAAAVILESTFTSVADMGRHYYPYLPITLLNHIKYPTLVHIDKISSPVMLIHSKEDDIVPYLLGRNLYDAANEPKTFLDIQGDHNYGYLDSGEVYTRGLQQFIETLPEQ